MVSFLGTVTSPSSGPSSPVIMRKTVVFPAPLGPTSPAFSPGFSWKDASTKRICLPYCLLTFAKAITGVLHHIPAANFACQRIRLRRSPRSFCVGQWRAVHRQQRVDDGPRRFDGV